MSGKRQAGDRRKPLVGDQEVGLPRKARKLFKFRSKNAKLRGGSEISKDSAVEHFSEEERLDREDIIDSPEQRQAVQDFLAFEDLRRAKCDEAMREVEADLNNDRFPEYDDARINRIRTDRHKEVYAQAKRLLVDKYREKAVDPFWAMNLVYFLQNFFASDLWPASDATYLNTEMIANTVVALSQSMHIPVPMFLMNHFINNLRVGGPNPPQ